MPCKQDPGAGDEAPERGARALEAAGFGAWEHDLAHRRLWGSPHLARLAGLDASPAGSAPDWLTLLHPDDRRVLRRAARQALCEGGALRLDVRAGRDGCWRWLRLDGRLLRDATGRPCSLAGTATDVQNERSALEDARQALLRLEGELAARTRLVAHVGHEVRTPLSGLMGLAEQALAGTREPGLRRLLLQVHQCGQALHRVVGDVLDLSRLEAGQLRLAPRPLDLARSLADTWRMLLPLADGRPLAMLFDVVDTRQAGPAWVLADEGALRQIATNLVGNAIRYTPRGRVVLTARVQAAEAGWVTVQLEVADTGPGIAPERQAEMFEPYVRGHGHAAEGSGGTGLGLAIAQRLALAMGAPIGVHCPPLGGSVFSLCLRLPLARAPRAALAAASRLPPAVSGLAWLVHPCTERGPWLAQRLRREGWAVRPLAQLDTALAVARERAETGGAAPDLVLLSQDALGGADGQTLLQRLRELRRALPEATVRLLIHPTWQAPDLEPRLRRLRMLPLVVPLTAAEIRGLARPPRPGRRLAGARPLRRIGPVPGAATGDVLLVEDNEVNQLLTRAHLNRLGLQVRVVSDGAQALVACTDAPPSLVLMDLQLPDMSGLQVTRALRDLQLHGHWPGAPIVALTAHADADEQAACHRAGMDAVLTKPLSLQGLQRGLARWLAV